MPSLTDNEPAELLHTAKISLSQRLPCGHTASAQDEPITILRVDTSRKRYIAAAAESALSIPVGEVHPLAPYRRAPEHRHRPLLRPGRVSPLRTLMCRPEGILWLTG
jgi:hypothetical protein